MKRLLSIEFQKIWLNKASRVLSLTYFILLSFIALIVSIKFDFGPFKFNLAEMGIFNFPYIWHLNTYIAIWFKLFLAVIIVSMTANEYTYGTLKQNLIDGMSKKEFILSKFITVVVFALASTVFIFIMTLLLGYSFSSYTEIGIVFSDLQYIGGYFVNLLGFFSFCLFAGILIKRSAFALGFLFIWFLVEGLIGLLLKWLVFNTWESVFKVVAFLPLQAISNLIVEPVSRLSMIKAIGTQTGMEYTKDYDVHFSGILIVLVWTAFFVFMSYRLLKKRDL